MEFSSDLSGFLLLQHLRAKLGTHYLNPVTKAKAIQSHGLLNEAVEKYFRHFIIAESVLNNIRPQEKQQEIHPSYSHSLPLSAISEIACMDSELTPKPLDSSKKEALVKGVEANILELKRNVTRYSQHFDASNINMTLIASTPSELVNLLTTYQKELSEGTEVLHEWLKIMETKLGVVLRTIHLFTLKGEALYLKIKILEQKILMKTYTEESLQVLKEIKQELQDRLERAKMTATRAESQLEAFQALGPQFDALAEEHALLAADAKRLKAANSAMRKRFDCLSKTESGDGGSEKTSSDGEGGSSDESLAQETVSNESVGDQTVSDDPVTDESVSDESVGDQTVSDDSVNGNGGSSSDSDRSHVVDDGALGGSDSHGRGCDQSTSVSETSHGRGPDQSVSGYGRGGETEGSDGSDSNRGGVVDDSALGGSEGDSRGSDDSSSEAKGSDGAKSQWSDEGGLGSCEGSAEDNDLRVHIDF